MRNHPLHFLVGFALGYLPVLFILAHLGAPAPESLAEGNSEDHITVVLETLEPESQESQVLAAAADSIKPETTPLQTETPEPEETSTPKPKVTPTSAPTETPEPTKEPTPTPTPVPTETPVAAPTATPDVWSPPEMEPWFAQYSGQYGIDKNILERIANCESHFNVNSQNGDYLGMFQFSAKTWSDNRALMGLDPNPSLRSNAEESIKTAAYVIGQRGTAPWPSCLR